MDSLEPIPQPDLVLPVDAAIAPAPPSKSKTPVDLLDVLLIFIVTAVAFFVVGGIAAGIYEAAHHAQHLGPRELQSALTYNAFFVVPAQFVTYLFVAGFMAFLVLLRHQTPLPEAIHWNTPTFRLAKYALTGGVCLALFSDVAEALLSHWIPKSLPITEYFHDRPSALLLGGFGILIAPVMEEIWFRGFLYPAVARWVGTVPSIIITAFAFTLMHGAQLGYSWAPMLPIFVVGVALTVTRVVTQSVAASVLVHMAYNFTLLFQTYLFTHGFRQM